MWTIVALDNEHNAHAQMTDCRAATGVDCKLSMKLRYNRLLGIVL